MTQTLADSSRAFWHTDDMFATYTNVLHYLNDLGLFHMDLTLERMQRALHRLDLSSPPYAVVQVVGTNGKGSTSTFLAALSQAHQYRTGLFTSPHFVCPRERILCNGRMLPETLWPRLAKAVHAAEPGLTYFEFLTVLAVLAFAEANVDLAVMEAGLGGQWDATTALRADIVCLTPISMDHQNVLGTTLTAIARDKAAALRPGATAIHAPQEPEVMAVLQQQALHTSTPLYAATDLAPLPQARLLGLHGPHQRENARLALAAWRSAATLCGWTQPGELSTSTALSATEEQALNSAFLPGRCQRIALPPQDALLPLLPLLLDGAHNVHGLHALRDALHQAGLRPSAVIFSCLADKDVENMLPLLRDLAGGAPLWIPAIHNPRALPSTELASRISPAAHPVPTLADALSDVRHSIAATPEAPVLLCGSLYLLGEFFTLYPQFLASPRAPSAPDDAVHPHCEDI